MKTKFYYLLILLTGIFVACDDDSNSVDPVISTGFYVCNEGLWNDLNTSSLSYYSFEENSLYANFFEAKNGRRLGDTPNQLVQYQNKMYCVVNGSGVIEVIDMKTGTAQQIQLKNDDGISRSPRFIAFDKNKAYVCSFDGTVSKIDLTTLLVEDVIEVGVNLNGIAAANGKLYVSNPGSNYADNKVKIIDINTFKLKDKIIETIPNPERMYADKYGDVYFTSFGGSLQRIDTKNDTWESLDIKANNFTIYEDRAYIYSFDYDENYNEINKEVKVYDVKNENLISDKFIQDATQLDVPYAIAVNPENNFVYIANVPDYTGKADILIFNTEGKFQKKITDVGINTNSIVFITE